MKSPFKFLDSYTKDDREIFFGRDLEIEELYQKVFDSKLLLVYGVSGTGKSSLIHCGLANKFHETDWLPLVIRRGGNMIESMAAEIKGASITSQQNKFSSPADFRKGVRSLYLDHYKPVFFIFDQFEELFIFGSKDERKEFVHIIKSLIDSDLQCRLIFIMREEYMAWITEFEKVISTFFANRVRIEKMSHRNALDAIKEPCKVFNISLEEGFAETLLEKLSPGSTEVELTFLQVFLDKVFRLAMQKFSPPGGKLKGGSPDSQESEGGITFTLPLLQKTGNVSDLLGSFLDDQISLMDDPDTAMTVLKAFVSGKGTKRPANEAETIDNVRSLGKEISQDLVTELLQAFVNLRVLRDKDDHGRYELRHDALAEKIFEKFSLAEKELLEIRQLIENAYQYYLKRKILLSSDDLAYISNKDSLLNLNAELNVFLQESRKHEIAKIKTVRRLTVTSILVFILLMLILAYYGMNQVKIKLGNYEAVKALSETKKPVEKFLRAASAWKMNPGVLPKEALLKTFNAIVNSDEQDSSLSNIINKYKMVFDPSPVEIQDARCSSDNNYIVGYGDSLILIWKRTGELSTTFRVQHSTLIDIKISDDSRYIGAVSSDSLLIVWDLSGEYMFSYRIRYNGLNTKQIFKFTKENNIITLSSEHDAVLLNPKGKMLQALDRHKSSVNAVDISPDNNFIATASTDNTIIIWYLNSLKQVFEYYNILTWHKDTVWSVSFSKYIKTVLSASADSMVISGSINNEIIHSGSFPHIKYCYCEFTTSNRGIISTTYDYRNGGLKKTFLASDVDNPTFDYYDPDFDYGGQSWGLIHGVGEFRFDSFVFSPNENYYIYTQDDKTFLADNKLSFEKDKSSIYNLMELQRSKHFFTSDSKNILMIDKNTFKVYYLDTEDIFKISSELRPKYVNFK